ncbi:YafY family protein [Actibacterium sp. 188UL27-1]|uniref:helix-turn-helix transcriptional regulator n=1 Tax=Actibacterium sp. 188UL27-1 TaxID=2786961 RepID=UPI001957F688|nr:YafY family protein [Actibacterium sp. 188UL27-1]MBM7067118.1 YafY family transcriptional regulator [Actibacterium sp. 188UL27-1]
MRRSNRLFEIIQMLRAASQPMTADTLAEALEVSVRTVYRDIAALQAMRTPIEGEAGLGYVMRNGYDLPPLNFDDEEIEALHVGLQMLARTGDSALQRAATRVCEKIKDLHCAADWLQVSPWGAPSDDPAKGCVSMALLRDAIRTERKIHITYRDAEEHQTDRTIRPIALIYHLECVMLAGWCEMRGSFRHFRTDRIYACQALEDHFIGQSAALRALWMEHNRQEEQPAPKPAVAHQG